MRCAPCAGRPARPLRRCAHNPGSEICDGDSAAAVSCDDLGYDSVAGGSVACNRTCTNLDSASYQCLPAHPFQLSQTVRRTSTSPASSAPWRSITSRWAASRSAARWRVNTRFMGRDIGIYQTGPSNAGGDIYDLTTRGTGATPGDYALYRSSPPRPADAAATTSR